MSSVLSLDFETRSEADLKKVGAHAYFEHPSTQVLCAGYAFTGEEPQLWLPDDLLIPDRIETHVKSGGIIAAWNANFERLAWRHIMVKKHGWPAMADNQWQCTMTESLSMNMPAQLKDAAPAFGLDIAKDDVGHRLMMKMCKPRKPRKGEDPNAILWHELPDDLIRLGQYCMQDVRVEAQIGKRVFRLSPNEQKLYLLDMKINDKGVFIDKELCMAAQKIVDSATERLDDEMQRVTNGAVGACSNVQQLLQWLKSRGVETESLDKEHIEDLLILELPDDCRRALELRQEGSKTSTAKIGSMLARRQSDGRMRGNLQMNGASQTLRYSARGTQLQNLTRPQILGGKYFDGIALDDQIQMAIDYIYAGSSIAIELVFGRPCTLVADCVRSMICAPEGKVLRSSDFSNIEGRVVAGIAGQEDKLDAFRAFDTFILDDKGRKIPDKKGDFLREGPDLYLVAAAGIFNVPVKEAKPFRQIGKVAELSMGYGGGAKAFAKMAKGYGMRIAELYDGIWGNSAEDFKDQALAAWDERGRKTGMSEKGWLAAEVVKLAWRAKNHKIAALWKATEDAAVRAIKQDGEIVEVANTGASIKFRKVGSFLFCMGPSGNAISYPYPRLEEKETPWGTKQPRIIFKAIDQFTRKWGETSTYGASIVENYTQFIARELMVEAMLRLDNAGYSIVLTVHDELISEDFKSFGSIEDFNRIMVQKSHWANKLPISVGGWEGSRYHK